MSSAPLVSAVMVNWNGAEHLRIALPTLKRQEYSPVEIIVVDNGSVDSSAKVAAQNEVVWLGLPRNLGLAAACNEGARRAHGTYLIFLNNDMRFPSDFVATLVKPLLEKQDIFATDALQLNWDGLEQIHLATRLRRLPLLGSLLGRGLIPGLDIEQDSVSHMSEVLQGSAAAMAVRRSMFEELNGFDERLPIGWEDTELCWRAWLRNWRTVLVPEARCCHHVSASGLKLDGNRARFRGTFGGRLLFATKHLPWSLVLGVWAVSCLAVARDLAAGRLETLLHRARVIREFAWFVPSLVSERRRLYRAGRTHPRAHLARMLSVGSERTTST